MCNRDFADSTQPTRNSTRWGGGNLMKESDRDYLDRITQVAYERYVAGSAAQDVPTLTIVPTPLTRQQTYELLERRLNYVAIFGAESIYFQDTVHALATDSSESGRVNVLGAHIDWISPDSASIRRALAVDKDGLVKEVAFEEPVPIHTVQILHLPIKHERQLHRKLSIRFRDSGIPQINPYEGGSERADDKAWTHSLWDQYGQNIVSPGYVLIPQHSSPEEIAEKLKAFIQNAQKLDLVVQPNRGTEGRKVEKFSVGTGLIRFAVLDETIWPEFQIPPNPPLAKGGNFRIASIVNPNRIRPESPVVRYIKDHILPEDDAIVREQRGNVRYMDSSSGSFLNVVFRINVAWNGSEFVAESGYAQMAEDEGTFPASRGRGGSIIDINDALANLHYQADGGWIRLIPADQDVAAMKTAAINAAYGLNAGLDLDRYLKFVGIDILLEAEHRGVNVVNVIPVVLEANPRPAGLSQSSEIMGVSARKPHARVSREIFRSEK